MEINEKISELKEKILHTIKAHIPKEILDDKDNYVDPECLIIDIEDDFEKLVPDLLKAIAEVDLLEQFSFIRDSLNRKFNDTNLDEKDYYGVVLLGLFHQSILMLSSNNLFHKYQELVMKLGIAEDFEFILDKLNW